jgi:hypothetical protein
LTLSSNHLFTRTGAFLVVLFVSLLSIAAILAGNADAARTNDIQVTARPAAADSLALSVRCAPAVERVGVYVDGHLRGVDTAAPWSFGSDGRLKVGVGRRAIAVVARDRGSRVVIHRSVVVGPPTQATKPSEEGGSSGPSEGNGSSSPTSGHGHGGGTGESVKVKVEPEEVTTPSESHETPASEPEPTASEPEAPSTTSELDTPLAPGARTPAGGENEILWRGDFDTGNLSQWEVNQSVEANRIQVVSNPVKEGKYAARFETRPTDNIGDTSPRSELAANLGEKEGEERWYRWYTYFPENFPVQYPEQFITFTQWRALNESEAYGSFMVLGDMVTLRQEGIGTLWEAPLTLGTWHKFVFHVKWSPNPNEGFYELYYDGHLVMPKHYLRTMSGTPGNAIGNYVKEGLYKSEFIPTGVLYQDGFVAGTSYNAVNEAE